ncbi:hypothetical protein IU450_35155 [Nocardia abscessus]|nr:hypothetical protein [Nocardia abscessus]
MSAHPSPVPPEVLERIEQRVPWPAVALIDHADTMREDTSGVKSAGTRRLAHRS